jgi:hypothetical protein
MVHQQRSGRVGDQQSRPMCDKVKWRHQTHSEFLAFDGWKPARLNRIVMPMTAAQTAKVELRE